MKPTNTLFALSVLCFVNYSSPRLAEAATVDAEPVPAVIQKGFTLYASGGPVSAFETWRRGGLLDAGSKPADDTGEFRQMVKPLGNYKSYEAFTTKTVSKSSKIVYLAINYERGVIYASFLVFKTEKDWVVQHMDFNTRPEVILPWLVLKAE